MGSKELQNQQQPQAVKEREERGTREGGDGEEKRTRFGGLRL